MTAAPEATISQQPTRGFVHDAVMYRDDAGYVDLAVPFIREGLTAGEPVLVAVLPPKIELLRDALGPAADEVQFVDMVALGRNPARIIPAWRDLIDANAGRPVRGIGEPVWSDRRPAELAEALLHEGLLNVAFADDPPLRLRCPYDETALDPAVLDVARATHPLLTGGTPSTCYAGIDGVTAGFRIPLPPPPPTAETVAFSQLPAVRTIRAMVADQAMRLGVDAERAGDLALAVHEIAVNSLRHGGGHAELRLWCQDGALVCELRDGGYIEQPLVGRLRPQPSQLSGRGVWLANQLCDLVQIRSSEHGTATRLHTYFPTVENG